ncbi:MAG: transglutaminase family protein [Cytophagales bacterium]|nr:MAG: transglutaminase family protein [Cytophagales bacterium]
MNFHLNFMQFYTILQTILIFSSFFCFILFLYTQFMTLYDTDFDKYLQPNFFTDSQHEGITDFVSQHTQSSQNELAKVLSLYYAVRDGFWYNPNQIRIREEDFRASVQVARSEGHCIDKANILAACARAIGVPSRLGFANVTNHIATEKVEKSLGTNVLVFHGYTELFLNGKWVKATPAFNEKLCKKIGVQPLDFDGENDSIFQQYSPSGDKFMEYLHDYGQFAELPFALMMSEWKRFYPHLFLPTKQHELSLVSN